MSEFRTVDDWIAENSELMEDIDSAYDALYAFLEDEMQDIPEDIAKLLEKALEDGDLYV